MPNGTVSRTAQLAYLWGLTEQKVRDYRRHWGVAVTYKTVDTCAAEFAALTPYLYSSYEDEDEVPVSSGPAVMILGSGPNRIGQGIEFDYCCVHAAYALRAAGYKRSWSTATRKPFRLTTTRQIVFISSR